MLGPRRPFNLDRDIKDLWAQLRFRLQQQGALMGPEWARLQQGLRPQSHLGPTFPSCALAQRPLVGSVTYLLLPLCVLEGNFCPGLLSLSLGTCRPGTWHSLPLPSCLSGPATSCPCPTHPCCQASSPPFPDSLILTHSSPA